MFHEFLMPTRMKVREYIRHLIFIIQGRDAKGEAETHNAS